MTIEDVLMGVDALMEDDLEPMAAIMRLVSREVTSAVHTGSWSPRPIAVAILSLTKAAPPPLDGLDVERLARAIALACADHNEECWFRANPERGADAIRAALRDEGETT